MIKDGDAIETSGELRLALTENIVCEYQLTIPKLESDTVLSNMVLFESVELEDHNEW